MGSVLLLAAAAILVLVLLGAAGRRRRARFKCHGCRHLRRTFEDGVMCSYGSRQVFKTRAHIRLCPDWQAAPGRR